MVTAVTTSTRTSATAAFNGRKLDRTQDGTLWAISETNQAVSSVGTGTGSVLRYSKDNGATWSTYTFGSNYNGLAGVANSSLFIDQDDCAHLVWKQTGQLGNADGVGGSPNNGTRVSGYIYYMRGTPNAGRTAWTWSTAVELAQTAPYNFPDVVACRNPVTNGWDAFVVASYVSGADNLAVYTRVPISIAGAIGSAVPDGAAFNSPWLALGGSYATGAHTYPSIDFNHTGDGKTVAGGLPHLYVGWNAARTGAGGGVRFRKAVYSGGAWTWNAEREIDNTLGAPNAGYWQQSAFDGTRFIVAGFTYYSGSGERLYLIERDAADTTTTTRYANSEGTATLLMHGSISYDQAGNVYLLGRDATGGNGTRKINWRKWTRSTTTLGPIVTVDSTASDAPYVSAKRGNQPGNSIEIVYTDGTSSPYTVQYDRTVPDVNAPTTPYTPMVLL